MPSKQPPPKPAPKLDPHIYQIPAIQWIYQPSIQEPIIQTPIIQTPSGPFANTHFINAEPSIMYNIPLHNPFMPKTSQTNHTTAIASTLNVVDDLVSSGLRNSMNYEASTTRLPTSAGIEDFFNISQNNVEESDIKEVEFAKHQIAVLNGPTNTFFNGNDLFAEIDNSYDPQSSLSRMESSKNSSYDAYSNRVIRPNNNPDGLGAVIDGLNLSVLPEGNELSSRVNNGDQDPYFNTNSNDLTGGLMSDLNLNNLLLGENSRYNRPKDLDLLEPDDDDEPEDNNRNRSLNFKSLNKRALTKNFKVGKWQGTGQRQQLKPTLSDVRGAKIPFKIPNMFYKGNQVDLVRRGNQTTDLINSEYEP
jgi:hypothetical protein